MVFERGADTNQILHVHKHTRVRTEMTKSHSLDMVGWKSQGTLHTPNGIHTFETVTTAKTALKKTENCKPTQNLMWQEIQRKEVTPLKISDSILNNRKKIVRREK